MGVKAYRNVKSWLTLRFRIGFVFELILTITFTLALTLINANRTHRRRNVTQLNKPRRDVPYLLLLYFPLPPLRLFLLLHASDVRCDLLVLPSHLQHDSVDSIRAGLEDEVVGLEMIWMGTLDTAKAALHTITLVMYCRI